MATQFGDTKRTFSTGDLVISVSEIFDRLQTKVDPTTLEQLLRDILAGRRNQVRPGELITAELINQILAELESLEGRVTKLESAPTTGTGGTGPGTGATGFIEVRYIDSPRGINLVPGDAAAFPHNFSVVNQTNQALPIQFAASVTGASGDWSKSIQITGPDAPVAAGATANFTVNVKAPASAEVGDQGVLNIDATVGPPHNKLGHRELAVTIASASGPPVTRSITFNQAQQPANTDNANPSAILPYVFDIKYLATQAPFRGDFKLTATLAVTPPETLSEWFFDFSNVPTTNQSAGVITTPLNLDSNAATDTRINVRVRTPATRSTSVDKTGTLTIRVDSTDPLIAPVVTATSGPFNLRLRRQTA